MIWRRWVTESSSSAPQANSDHLHRRLSNTRMRPPQSGFVQVFLWEATVTPESRASRKLSKPDILTVIGFQIEDLAGAKIGNLWLRSDEAGVSDSHHGQGHCLPMTVTIDASGSLHADAPSCFS